MNRRDRLIVILLALLALGIGVIVFGPGQSLLASGQSPSASGQSLSPSGHGTVPVTPSQLTVPGAGLTGPVGPTDRSCQGIMLTPADDIQKAISAHPPGTTFCLSAGTYRLVAPLAPKPGDKLIGRLGAVLNGSKVLTGWRKDGRVWTTSGFLPAAPGTFGECMPSVPTCTYTQDVFFDKHRLRRVTSPSAVASGTVYANYRTNTITIGEDPQSHLVEQAVAPSLIYATVDDVIVANLVLEEAANQAQVGAVESRGPTSPVGDGTGWVIVDNDVLLNHGVGIGFGGNTTVAGNLIQDQGQLGFGAAGNDLVVTDNEISSNGTAGYSADWEAGGSKSWMTDGEIVTHNYVDGNMGPGLWDDGGNINTTYAYNKVVGNWGAGIQHEISYDAVIEYNEISGNGFKLQKGWAWDAGIQIQSSGGTKLIDIAYNVVANNYNGITVLDSSNRTADQPAPYGPHIVENVSVHNNEIAMSGSAVTGAVEDDGHVAIFNANRNRFYSNAYYLDSLAATHFAWATGNVDWSDWRRFGNDSDGQSIATASGSP